MITRDDITLTDRHLGLEYNTQSYEVSAIFICEHHKVIERPQGKPPVPSDFDDSVHAILRSLYGSIYKELSLGIQLLHNDPTQARQVLNELHTKLHNALNS